jgi:hypothetical protein
MAYLSEGETKMPPDQPIDILGEIHRLILMCLAAHRADLKPCPEPQDADDFELSGVSAIRS